MIEIDCFDLHEQKWLSVERSDVRPFLYELLSTVQVVHNSAVVSSLSRRTVDSGAVSSQPQAGPRRMSVRRLACPKSFFQNRVSDMANTRSRRDAFAHRVASRSQLIDVDARRYVTLDYAELA